MYVCKQQPGISTLMIDSALQDQEQTNQYLLKGSEEVCFAVLVQRIFTEYIFDYLISDHI